MSTKKEDTRHFWACQLRADPNGNIVFNLPPTEGTIELTEDTEYFIPIDGPRKKYQISVTGVYAFQSQKDAEHAYEQLIGALEHKATHLMEQVHYVRYRWEDTKKERSDRH